jgi:hypothetical protein
MRMIELVHLASLLLMHFWIKYPRPTLPGLSLRTSFRPFSLGTLGYTHCSGLGCVSRPLFSSTSFGGGLRDVRSRLRRAPLCSPPLVLTWTMLNPPHCPISVHVCAIFPNRSGRSPILFAGSVDPNISPSATTLRYRGCLSPELIAIRCRRYHSSVSLHVRYGAPRFLRHFAQLHEDIEQKERGNQQCGGLLPSWVTGCG